jgi:hypothetical protein
MNNQADIQNHFDLRRCILQILYAFFQEFPYGLAELHQFQEQCQCSSEELNWNIVYLEKCGFVELDKSMGCPPYVSCTASITAEGIDLVEHPAQLDKKFPQPG